ncbi:hypothetical protein Taro_031971, partial [Colocasia esculenta]|nr:hypothetical protein [Colocasia esculenta]
MTIKMLYYTRCAINILVLFVLWPSCSLCYTQSLCYIWKLVLFRSRAVVLSLMLLGSLALYLVTLPFNTLIVRLGFLAFHPVSGMTGL